MGVACSKHDATIDGNNPHPHNYVGQLPSQNGQAAAAPGIWAGCLSSCSGMDPAVDPRMDSCRADAIDPVMYDLCKKSLNMTLQDEENKIKVESALPHQHTSSSSSSPQHHAQSKQQQKQQRQVHQPKQHQKGHVGQYHLLYKHQTKAAAANTSNPATGPGRPSDSAVAAEDNTMEEISTVPSTSPYSTRLIVRRRPIAAAEEGTHGTHLYAIRYPPDDVVENKKVIASSNSESSRLQEQCPPRCGQREKKRRTTSSTDPAAEPIPEPPRPSPAPPQHSPLPTEGLTDFFQPARMKQSKTSKQTIHEWVTVSEEHCIYVVDVGLKPAQCDKIVQVTEQVCRGQYAAYTYAKQTLGCREFPILAQACAPPVQAVVQAILGLPSSAGPSTSSKPRGNNGKGDQPQQHLQLDDREPHLVKYDVTKKERQKLDMHTDKSEWTFLIALSNGCGLDYDGGGTYFECLNATIHVQRGHALIFPGKLRHCGQRITRGLRYLLVGFLVDKAHLVTTNTAASSSGNNNTSSSAAKGNAGVTGKNENEDHSNTNSASGGGATATGTKPVSARTLTGMPTTIASA